MREKYGYGTGNERDFFQKGFDAPTISRLRESDVAYFKDGEEMNVSLLFIDICNFSTRMSELSGGETAAYFSQYYNIVFPIIFKYGGVIERVIGDGVVALFGKPFISLSPHAVMAEADLCAKDILLVTNGTKFSSKIAFHCGKVRYFKNHSGYEDYTVIGKAITELFRLESISVDQSICFFDRGVVKIFYDMTGVQNWPEDIKRTGHFVEYYQTILPPKGTDYHGLCYIEHRN